MALTAGGKLGSYELQTRLGSGGMGEVWKAYDPKLQRTVAIKILTGDTRADAAELVLREARAASALNHPHICTIHDVGEAEVPVEAAGLQSGAAAAPSRLRVPYIVMEFVDGKPLSQLVPPDGLPPETVIRYGVQIADALANAHASGIVHRDLKSANVVITADGRAKVLDFGVADRLPPTDVDAVTRTHDSRLGSRKVQDLVGTLAYMAPEVLRGEGATRQSDIWALGVLLYEVASGRLPFEGASAVELTAAILKEPAGPQPPGVPPGLRAITQRALAKQPGLRYASAGELKAALEAIGSSGGPRAGHDEASNAPSVAVLPFTDMSPQQDQTYFCEGMADEIINALTRVTGLKVASRASAFQFKGQSIDIRRIGNALNVTRLLQGSVRTAGNRLRVTAQLIDIANGYQVWSERYDRQMEDVFDIQDEISKAIAEALTGTLGVGGAMPGVDRYTTDLEAYHLYLQGRHHWFSRYRGGLEKALRCFEFAIDRDPRYAPAHAGVALVYLILGNYGFLPPKVAIPRAKAAATRALGGGRDLADAHVALGLAKLVFDWDWSGAEWEFVRATELEPANILARTWRGLVMGAVGRHGEAVAHGREAEQLDPLSVYPRACLAMFLHLAGRHDDALSTAGAVLREDPDFVIAVYACASAAAALSRHDEAIAQYEHLVQLSEQLPVYLGLLGRAYVRAGRRPHGEAILDELRNRSDREYVPPISMALVAMALGDADRAFAWLDQEQRDRGVFMWWLRSNPWFDDFRSDPRFDDLLRRIHFPA